MTDETSATADWLEPAHRPRPRQNFSRLPWATRLLLNVMSRIEIGRLEVTVPDGRRFAFVGRQPGPAGVLNAHDLRVMQRTLTGGSLGFAESYLAGEWSSPDVAAFLETVLRNGRHFADFYSITALNRVFGRLLHWLRPNSKAGARRNIHAHYDLGNAFYELWLDPSMTYSAAKFANADQSLEDAQTAKYRALAEMIDLRSGEHVLEIGCGWGGFASYAARERDARVTGITISREQLDFGQLRTARLGLGDRVDLRFQDYRDTSGQYDKIVSIEMFEAVGERYWQVYFDRLAALLKPGGVAALQVITIAEDEFAAYRSQIDFIQKYVFPGGMLPPKSALAAYAGRSGLKLTACEPFGQDYARTLEVWQQRFEAAWPQIQALGFDDRFRRLWIYYLAYCRAGFRCGSIDVVHARFEKA